RGRLGGGEAVRRCRIDTGFWRWCAYEHGTRESSAHDLTPPRPSPASRGGRSVVQRTASPWAARGRATKAARAQLSPLPLLAGGGWEGVRPCDEVANAQLSPLPLL